MTMDTAIRLACCVAGLLLACAQDVQAQEQWRLAPAEMPTPRAEASVVALDGQIYVIGGVDREGRIRDVAERFDPVQAAWAPALPPMKRARSNAAAVVLEGAIYVIGGRGDEDEVTDHVERYDPEEGSWREVAGLREAREGHAAVVLEGQIVVLGGAGEHGSILRSAEIYDPVEDEWVESEAWRLDLGRVAFASVVLGDQVFLFGGIGGAGLDRRVLRFGRGGFLNILNPAGPFVPRAHFAAVVFQDSIFLIGGRGPERQGRPNILNDVVTYDPAANRWRPAPSLVVPRERFGAVAVEENLYVFGGVDAFGDVLGSVEVLEGRMPVGDETPPRPVPRLSLGPNYPNPVKSETTIPFDVPSSADARVRLDVFDLFGRRVATLVDAVLPPGPHTVRWDGRTLDGRAAAAGVYVVRLQQGGAQAIETLSIIR